MTSRKTLIAFAAIASLAGVSLAACETDSYSPAAAADHPLNRACRPGDTPAGTRSGQVCDSGSSTAPISGGDANVQGAASAGSAPSD